MKYYGKITDDKDLTTKEYVVNNCEVKPTVVTGTLTAGETSITLSNSAITTSSILDVYTDVYGVAPKTMVAAAGSVTMTFKAQESDLGIRLEVK